MANIKQFLEKEIAAGCTHMNREGVTLSMEKITAFAQKEYVTGLNKGTIDFSISFPEYLESVEKRYTPLVSVISILEAEGFLAELDRLKPGDMPEPIPCDNLMSVDEANEYATSPEPGYK